MDFFQKLLGAHEPTLMTIESDRWIDAPLTGAGAAHLEKRCAKEKWTDHRDEEGHEFLALAMIEGGGMTGVLKISSQVYPLVTLTREQSEPAMAQMRADHDLRTTTVRARAQLDKDGRWRLSLNL
ncbi:hypothetical protein [Schaalia vaccimaxillae]|uniref:hypothetical protein n=1 Tax=Schaalia vaccimaxillae TaxID=183916 RepID=UPI0003B3D0D3|nr:hypothetical protein [Schaalia vaccimaxillae]